MAELYGWAGKILMINLTTRAISTVPTSNYVPKWIGGRALAAKLYWDTVPPQCTAFDPENALIFATGPASGTLGAGSKTCVTTKAPQVIPECYFLSVTGGHWSAELKFAGFDAVVVTGKAPEPTYILITDDKIQILKAERLWGLTTSQTDAELRKLWGDRIRCMMIGPAGENLVKIGQIITDASHATGIGGLGAVMGSKNLKAIAVRGTGRIKVARPKDLIAFYDENVKIGGKYGGPAPGSSQAYSAFTHGSAHLIAYAPPEIVPKPTQDIDSYFNWEDGQWTKCLAYRDEINAGTMKQKWEGCWACPVCCGIAIRAEDTTGLEAAPYNMNIPSMNVGSQCNEMKRQGEWEVMSFHGKIGGRATWMYNSTNAELGILNQPLGDEYNWWKEAVAAGLLTRENTGLPIDNAKGEWNTAAWVGKDGYNYGITYRRSEFFKRLAEGPDRFCASMASENPKWKAIYDKCITRQRYYTAIHRKSGGKSAANMLEDATLIKGQANGASSVVGSGKTLDKMLSEEEIAKAEEAVTKKWAPVLGPKWRAADTWEDKVAASLFFQNLQMEMDSMPMCGWAGFPRFYSLWTPDHVGDPTQGVKMLAAITGIDRTFAESLAAMEAAVTLERAIRVREGQKREDSYYTDACFAATKWTTKAEFGKVLDDYFKARGWDKNGIPTRAQLEKLGLKDVADDLEKKFGVKVPA